MAETYPSPVAKSTAAADALGGTTHQRTQIPFVAEGTLPSDSPTLFQQLMRQEYHERVGLSAALRGQARKTGTLKVAVYPFRYRKADGTDAHYESGATELTLTAAATNYVYVDHADNTLKKDTSGWPADITTFTPIAIYVCDVNDIVTADEDAYAKDLLNNQTHASSTSPTGTTGTSFTLDNDNAGAGADTAVQFNRGSTAADAQLEWNETDDRFELESELSGPTLAALNLLAVLVSGTTMLDANGAAKVAAAVAGDGLTHSSGVLAVNPDGTTLEISSDAVRVKDGGISTAKLADALADKLVQLSVGDASGVSPRTVTIQALDAQGNNLAEVVYGEVLVCQDADGAALATNATIADGGAGSVRYDKGSRLGLTAGKWLACKTDANGTLEIQVTDGTSETVYVLVAMGERSRRMDCQDYGTVVIS